MARSLERLSNIYFALAKGIDTPRSLKAWLLFREKEWQQLIDFSVHPSEYTNADSFAVDYAVTSFIRKNEALPAKIDKRAAAIQSFEHSENQCLLTNRRLAERRASGSFWDSDVERILYSAQRKIARLLGAYEERKWIGLCAWGPGATDDMSRREAYLDSKHVRLPISVTSSSAGYFLRAMSGDLHWLQAVVNLKPSSLFEVVRGGVHDTVPKTAGIDRNIEKNPRANTFLQKGIGKYLRKRLKAFGVDLNDQSINQVLASQAKEMGLCTLDLKNASDTIATEVIFELLPVDWALTLDDLRTKEMLVNDEWRRCHRFSSMGNGFTFELESLIFWSIVSSVEEENSRTHFGVYGDDLICHNSSADLVIRVLTQLGFSLNESKSFREGEFFESCGKHYYGKIDVTPLYQKDELLDDLDLIRCGNRLLRFAARLGHDFTLDKRVRGAWEAVRREAGNRIPIGPIGEGDEYFCVPKRELGQHRWDSGRGYQVDTLTEVFPLVPAYDESLYSLWLRMRSQQIYTDSTTCGIRDLQIIIHNHLPRLSLLNRFPKESVRSLRRLTTVDEELGMLPSRAEERGRLRRGHTWVTPRVGSHLDW